MMEELIKLTNALYKVTGLFPAKEPLKFAIRKEALDVLFFCIASDKQASLSQLEHRENSIKKGLDCLKLVNTYFEIAKEQNWIDGRNFLVLSSEYRLVEVELNQELLKISAQKIEKQQIQAASKPVAEKKEEVRKEAKPIVEKEIIEPKKKEVVKPEVINMPKSIAEIDYEELTSIQLKVLELLQGSGELKPHEINKYFPNVTARSVRRELQGLKQKHIIDAVGSGRAITYKINLAV